MVSRPLITGFLPFYTNTLNPSSDILSAFKSTKILNVSYLDVRNFIDHELDYTSYDFILHLGLAQKREKVSIEQFAFNEVLATIPDNDGELNHGKILEHGDERLQTSLNVTLLVDHLKRSGFKGLVEESVDPGRYVCNYLYYLSLKKKKEHPVPVLFIHLPTYEMVEREKQISLIYQILELSSKL